MTFSTSNNPTVIVIGGPNGAGKSTIAPVLIDRQFSRVEFVNADTIARGLSGLDPDRRAFAAGRIMLRHITNLAAGRQTFAFESTLASRTFAPFLKRLHANGYFIHVLYIWVKSPNIAIERVRSRVVAGGHAVPEAVIRRRFTRSASNLFDLYLPLAGAWEVLDNSGPGNPAMVATGGISEHTIIHDENTWKQLEQCRHDP